MFIRMSVAFGSLRAAWSTDSGVLLSSYAVENSAYGHSRSVGLRALNPPPKWHDIPRNEDEESELRWAGSEPWSDDYHENWYVGAISLGMSRKDADDIHTEADVIYDGGFVRGVRNPKQALLARSLGYHLMSVGVKVGQRLGWDIFDYNPDWERKLSPHPHAEITYDGEIVTRIDLYVKDDELFEALGNL